MMPPRLRQSTARRLLSECPAQVRWELDHPEERTATKAMDLGSLVDQLVFGGASFHVIAADSYRTKVAQQERDDARERGQVPVLEKELEPALRLAGAIRARLLEHGIDLRACIVQQRMEWLSRRGVSCEGTPDFCVRPSGPMPEWVTVDLKVGANADPNHLDRYVYDQGLDIQAAAYQEAGHVLFPETDGRGNHFLVVAEVGGACLVGVHPLDEAYMEVGRRRWARAQNIWQRCWDTSEWPEYPSRPLSPPAWVWQKETQQS